MTNQIDIYYTKKFTNKQIFFINKNPAYPYKVYEIESLRKISGFHLILIIHARQKKASLLCKMPLVSSVIMKIKQSKPFK